MSRRRAAPPAARLSRTAVRGAVVLAGALLAGVAVALPCSPSVVCQAAASTTPVGTGEGAASPTAGEGSRRENGPLPPLSVPATALGEADGAVPNGTTVFDEQVPAVGRLDPALLAALRRAATAAAAGDHLELRVNSGWRSTAHQQQLLLEAVAQQGSLEEAARWVATPQTSPHVSGDAVDIGPPRAAAWLAAHGGTYGLCRIYRNEPWHFELRPEAVDRACPAEYTDPTHDPRMQP